MLRKMLKVSGLPNKGSDLSQDVTRSGNAQYNTCLRNKEYHCHFEYFRSSSLELSWNTCGLILPDVGPPHSGR